MHSSSLLAIIALPLLCWQLLVLSQQGLASAHHFKNRYYLQQWQQSDVSAESYQDALRSAQLAMQKSPAHPHYVLSLAKTLEWGLFAGLETSPEPSLAFLYEHAIALRPGWPNAYADYAWSKAYLEGDLASSMQLLRQARKFGPYADEVLEKHASIGLDHWQYLGVDDKFYLLDVFAVMSQSHWRIYRVLQQQVEGHAQQRLICRYLLNQPLSPDHATRLERQLCRRFAGR
ncbi:hypothetical protein [Alkalimonas mucilaginosa]|uniref:Uncharacterized protein n=1 Tax=Alkalimonas mucilaginosa TaxID=3057676 RepID=A0ABU7JFN5_9GAMM|nr:hypothetical protein [Alkalimonas sp. MEB004]MEE2024489.1 hypothetical protein [Alkalimonas sp. MEB004]